MRPIEQIVKENRWNCSIAPTNDVLTEKVKGYHLKFPNGRIVSAQVGVFNYCSNRRYERLYSAAMMVRFAGRDEFDLPFPEDLWTEAQDCEIATFVEDYGLQMAYGNGDSVRGYIPEILLVEFVDKLQYVDRHYGINGVCAEHNISRYMGCEDDRDEEEKQQED